MFRKKRLFSFRQKNIPEVKAIKVKPATHSRFKTAASKAGMFHDAFQNHLLDEYERSQAQSRRPVVTEPTEAERARVAGLGGG